MKQKYGINNIQQLFLDILPAQIFSFVTSSLSGIANGILVGAFLSNLDMIALGFVSPIVQIMTVCATIVSSGARIVCGRFMGRGEKDKISEAFTTSIKTLIVIGISLTIIAFFGSDIIASIIANGDTYFKTSEYIRGISIGIIPTIIVPCLMVFLQMENYGTYSLIATIFLACVNFAIGFVALKYLNAGIFAVGFITSISQYLTLLFIIIKFIRVKNLPRLIKCKSTMAKEILAIGLPSALATLCYAFRNSILNSLAAFRYGNDAVNALSIMNTSCGPLDAINIGTGQTALMLASVYIGEKDKDSLKTLALVTFKIGVVLALIKVIGLAIFGKDLAILFGAENEVINLSASLYFAYSLAMPLNMIALFFMNTYQAFGKIKYCNIICLFTAIINPLTFAFIGGYLIGHNSIWFCYPVAEVEMLIGMFVVACVKKKKFVTNLDDLINLDTQLEIGEHMSISIKTIDEVVEVSKKVQDYCLSQGIDAKKSMIAALCCEEMAGNIVEHGFTKSKKKNKTIDIFVDTDNSDINIRIKDNAVPFDPYVKLHNSDSLETNIGIRMVSKLAKEMNYQNTFGLNVLTINL